MHKTTGRLEALSDGIFAVAITLLAGELRIEEYAGATNLSLWQKIAANWPQYFAYATSFTGALLVWMGHHRLISQLQSTNQRFALLNGLGLFFVVLLPYPSRMVGLFIGTNAQEAAVACYAAYNGLLVLSMTVLTGYLLHNSQLLVSPSTSLPWLKRLLKYQVVGFVGYELVAVLALYYSAAALIVLFLMGALWVFATDDGKEEDHLVPSQQTEQLTR